MAQITSREELEEWLQDKPADWAQVIAARAALRVLPYAFAQRTRDEWVKKYSIALFRATAIAWAASNFSAHDMGSAAADAAQAAADYTALDTARAATDSVRTDAARADPARAAADAGLTAAAFAADVAHPADPARAAVWANIDDDCDWLANRADPALAARLTGETLWAAGASEGCSEAWVLAMWRLVAFNEGYSVWIDWYNRRIEGHDAAFDIPGDTDRTEDKKILARLADATDEDFWNKGAGHVNTTLQGWIDEARERVRLVETPDEPPPPTPDAIRTVAAQIASPNVTLTNNQLDVTTNTAFDGQTDAANLDEAIAVLRAVVGALLGGLPGNAPRSFAANLTIYDGELAKRDAKPFLGVLVRMEKSVSAGFHADPEMFDAGVTTNFESYFDAHLEFMAHYRRNEEREAKIAQFKVDEDAASGAALIDPVNEVAQEVDALAEQGLVTNRFAEAMREQRQIMEDIANAPRSGPFTGDGPSPKTRHILQTVGFYERTLTAANNIVSTTAQFGAFLNAIRQAIEALLKFF